MENPLMVAKDFASEENRSLTSSRSVNLMFCSLYMNDFADLERNL